MQCGITRIHFTSQSQRLSGSSSSPSTATGYGSAAATGTATVVISNLLRSLSCTPSRSEPRLASGLARKPVRRKRRADAFPGPPAASARRPGAARCEPQAFALRDRCPLPVQGCEGEDCEADAAEEERHPDDDAEEPELVRHVGGVERRRQRRLRHPDV